MQLERMDEAMVAFSRVISINDEECSAFSSHVAMPFDRSMGPF